MELEFDQSACSCLKQVLCEVRNLEQAQEIRLTDGMPDIGRVLCGWGQVLQRSKEWNGDSVSLSAGMMVWILYAPEDGTEPRCVEGWIPFTMSWDLPESCPEGKLKIRCMERFVDARSVSARKLMVRAGVGALAQAYVPYEARISCPKQPPEGVELKHVTYPLQLAVEAGEKTFEIEEDLSLPPTVSPMEKLICYSLDPEILEQRVLTDKVVFKGNANVHMVYSGEEGKLHSWDLQVPFSQYAQLENSCSPEAEGRVCCGVTMLELEQTSSDGLHLKSALVGQYLVEDRKELELIADAYSPLQEVTAECDSLELSQILENRRETVSAEAGIPGNGDLQVDVVFRPDFPRQRVLEGKICLELSGTVQALYYGPGGELQGAVSRWEDTKMLEADQSVRVCGEPLSPSEPQILMGSGEMKIRTDFPLQIQTVAGAGIPMVTGLQLGEKKQPDENRPSLILKRAEQPDLWQIAKETGSTVCAIQNANGLTGDPAPGQMLLIPIL